MCFSRAGTWVMEDCNRNGVSKFLCQKGNAINNFFDKNGVEDQTFDNLTYKFILHLENFDTFGLKKYSFFKWRTNSTNGESPNGVQISKWRMTQCIMTECIRLQFVGIDTDSLNGE